MARNREIVSYESKLNNLFRQIDVLPDTSLVRDHWAKYLCIVLAGYLETAVRELYMDYAQEKSSPYVANYVKNRLNRFQNAKMRDILELTQTFNPDWRNSLHTQTEGQLANHINSIVSNRHQIAHGRDTSVNLVQVRDWHRSATQVVTIIENLLA